MRARATRISFVRLAGLGQPPVAVGKVVIVSPDDVGDDEEDRDGCRVGRRGPGVCRRACRCRGRSGRSPASLAAALFDSVPISGSSAIRRATVRSATPLMVRKAASSFCHSGSLSIRLHDPVCQLADLAGEELEQRVKRAAHRGIGDQAALVGLGGAQLGQLAQPGDQCGELLLGRRGRGLGGTMRLTSANQAMTPVSMRSVFSRMPIASAKRRTARGLTMAAGTPAAHTRQTATSRIHRSPPSRQRRPGVVYSGERGQPGNPEAGRCARSAAPLRRGRAGPRERSAADIYSTDEVRHGNLPCPCDRQSSDCSVVRDTAAGGPMAHPRLLPEVGRAAARRARVRAAARTLAARQA